MIDGWLAYDRIEPISSQWSHTATAAAAAHNAVALLAAAQGVQIEPASPADYVPNRTAELRPEREPLNADQVQEILRRKFGV